jgi:hypothetical protein
MQRHCHQEFIRFPNAVEAEVPAGKMIHVIVDNYATHKHPKVKAPLARHRRFVFHFAPTSCSWLNAVEGFFAKLTKPICFMAAGLSIRRAQITAAPWLLPVILCAELDRLAEAAPA